MDGLRRSIALLVVLTLGMAALPEVDAVRYTVGGNMGWTTNVNYTVWAQGKQFYNGDWLYVCHCARSCHTCVCLRFNMKK